MRTWQPRRDQHSLRRAGACQLELSIHLGKLDIGRECYIAGRVEALWDRISHTRFKDIFGSVGSDPASVQRNRAPQLSDAARSNASSNLDANPSYGCRTTCRTPPSLDGMITAGVSAFAIM